MQYSLMIAEEAGFCCSLSVPKMALTPNFRYGVVFVPDVAVADVVDVVVVVLGSGETGDPRERLGRDPTPRGDRVVGVGRCSKEDVRSRSKFSTMKEAEVWGSAGWAGWWWGWWARAGWGTSWLARNTPW